MDECLEPSYCEHGRCENFLGGFNCSCDSGYIRSDDKKTCIGEWNFRLAYKIVQEQCFWLFVLVSCHLHWKVMTNVYISLLADKDECTQISGLCGNGTCVNTAGSFRCSCHNGFRLDRRGYCRGEKVIITVWTVVAFVFYSFKRTFVSYALWWTKRSDDVAVSVP